MAFSYTIGSQVGRFLLEAEIGRGSTGVVYQAQDLVFHRPIALKILAQHLTLDESARARFEREATAVAKLKHPNIAQIHEFAVLPDCLYLATEWVEGRTLAALLKDHKPLPLERALNLFDQLASALDYAHEQGVIHYDIKPANVMVDTNDHVFLVDFELAWLSDTPSSTNAGMLFGTPRYMAPEQIRGDPVDGRADIYSLAAVLFEMLTGQPPFIGESTPALLYHHLYTAPPPVTEINPSLPTSVETALLRALAKRPLNRFETAAEFGLALRSPTPVPYPAARAKVGTAPLSAPAMPGTAPVSVPPSRRWVLPLLPIWLWWVVVGSLMVWALTFLAFRAYRLTIVPVPTVMATLTPQPSRVVAAHVGGTFSPQDLSPTPDMDDIVGLGQGTPARGTDRGQSLVLTAASAELGTSVPLTFTRKSPATAASNPNSTATIGSPFTNLAGTNLAAAATASEQAATPTPEGTSAPASQVSRTVVSTLGTTAARTPATPPSPTSPAPTLAPTKAAPSPTRTPLPSRTPTPIPTATPTPPPSATLTPIPSATPTTVAPVAGGTWPMASGDAASSGYVSGGLPSFAFTLRWQVPAAGGTDFGLVVGKGLVIYSTTGTDVRAVNWATGATVWTRALGAELAGNLLLGTVSGDQAIVVAPTTAGVLALSVENGTIAWRNTTSDGLVHAALGGLTAGSDGTLYAVTHTGWLYTLNPANGKLLRSRQLPSADEYSLPPSLAGGTVTVASPNRVVQAFTLNSLTSLWSQTLDENLNTPPCASEALGLAYIGGDLGSLYALRLDSGQTAWSAQTPSQVVGLANDGGQVYATSSDGTLSAWDGATGAPVWAVSAGGPLRSPPLTDGAQVMVTTLGGQVRFFSTATGQELDNQRMLLNDPFYQGAAPAGGWLFLRGSSLYGVSP
jgi:serine/threonine protein kinase/outer membrane protein assembly factor BamB